MAQGYEIPRIRRVVGRVIEIEHLDLPKTPRTRLNAAAAAAATTLTVLDNSQFDDPHFALIRPLGTQRAEIGDITGVTGATTINLNAGLSFAHSAGEEVFLLAFNQWNIYGTDTTTFATTNVVASGIAMDVSQPFTTYINTGTEYTYYWARALDSIDTVNGVESDPVASTTGYASNSVQNLINQSLTDSHTKLGGRIDFEYCLAKLNQGMEYIRGKLKRLSSLQTFNSSLGQTTRGAFGFTMPTDAYDRNTNRSILGVYVGTGTALEYRDKREFEEDLEGVARTQIRTAAVANDTSLDVDNSYDFKDSGGVGNDLVGYWKFNENTGTTAFDSTANSYDGTITGATYVTGQSGQALDFDGTNDIVTVTDATNIQNIFDSGGSVSFWINPDTDGEGDLGRILNKVWDVHVASEASGNVEVIFEVPFSTTNGIWSTAVNIPTNAWTHVVITYNNGAVGNNPTIYINGSSVTATEDQTPVGTRTTDVGTDLDIGNNAATTRTFDGTIDEVRFYSRAISSDEVTTLNQNPGGGSHSVSVYVSGVKHTVDYTDITFSTTAGVLMGVPYSGDGSITVSMAVDLNVWQSEEEGKPTGYTVYDGSLYIYPLPGASYDNLNLTMDYYTGVNEVNSAADTLDIPRFNLLRNWLTWQLRSLKNQNGQPDMKDGDFLLFQETLRDMIFQELNGSGQKYKRRPKRYNLTGSNASNAV